MGCLSGILPTNREHSIVVKEVEKFEQVCIYCRALKWSLRNQMLCFCWEVEDYGGLRVRLVFRRLLVNLEWSWIFPSNPSWSRNFIGKPCFCLRCIFLRIILRILYYKAPNSSCFLHLVTPDFINPLTVYLYQKYLWSLFFHFVRFLYVFSLFMFPLFFCSASY